MTKEQLFRILQRYQDGTISPDERVLLQKWYEQGVDSDMELEISPNHVGENEEKMKAALYERLTKMIGGETGRGSIHLKKVIRYAVAAAACLFLLIVGYSYHAFFYTDQTDKITNNGILNDDVTPGKTHAYLTLSDGRTLSLDSAATGTVGKEGNVTFINARGQLSYNAPRQSETSPSYNTLSTQKGNQYKLLLPDGSKVWLNAASSIKFPTVFNDRERRVEVTGEAYFEVVHNSKVPFLVQAGHQVIEDVGTHFNVNSYANEPTQKTTLLEGSIKIGETILKPGEQACTNDKGEMTVIKDADFEDAIAWKNGIFRFRSVDIAEIMKQIARWYDVEIVYEGSINETFSGGISRSANLSEVLKELAYSQKMTFEITGKKVIVKPQEKK